MVVSGVPVMLPPLPPERKRRTHRAWRRRFRLYHDDRRVLLHRHGCVDRARIADANAAIGSASWLQLFFGIFGDLNAALHYLPCRAARILKFPERRSDLARLRAEIEELQRTFRCAEAV
jgi:hypothetical protein